MQWRFIKVLIYTLAQLSQLEEIFTMYTKAIQEMNHNEIYQWDELYPMKEDLEEDIKRNELMAVFKENEIVAAYVVNQESDEQYENGTWKYMGEKYRVLHRLCVNPAFQNQGIAKKVVSRMEEEQKKQGIKSIRLDVFTENPYAVKLYKSLGYKITGSVEFRKGKFYLMEKYGA